jgi:hypothetical protein
MNRQLPENPNYVPYPESLKLLVRATATGANIFDFSGFARPLTISSAIGSTSKPRINPYSIYLNGSAYFTNPTDANQFPIVANTPFVVSGWFNATSVASSPCLFCTVGSNAFYLYISSTTLLNVGIAGSETGITVPTLSTGTWYHWMLTRTTAGVFSFYLNGVSATISLTNASAINASGLGFVLGMNQAFTNYLSGFIDEFAFWNGVTIPISQLYPKNLPFNFKRCY